MMPRRKRNACKNESRRKVRRLDSNENEPQLISDSENEEEEENTKVTTRALRWLEREKRIQVQDMTEEEMLALAIRLSKQEASSATHIEQLEDADLKKAISESLNVSHGQAPESNSYTSSSTKGQDQGTVHLRRKLTFPSKVGKCIASDEDDAAAVSNVECTQQLSPLPLMPDLSQRNTSQPSPPNQTPHLVPHSASQESLSIIQKDLDKHLLHADSVEDEPSLNTSQLHGTSPLSASLTRDQPSKCKALRTLPCTHDSSLSLTCPDRSQPPSSSPPKSPVFVKTDPKGSTKLTEVSERFQISSSHKNEFPGCSINQRCRSLSGKVQPSVSVSGSRAAGLKQEALKPKQMKSELCGNAQERTCSKAPLSANTKPADQYISHMVLHMSDDDDDEDGETIVLPSPVFSHESSSHAAQQKLSPTQLCHSPPTTISTIHTPSPTTSHSVQTQLNSASSTQHLRTPLKNQKERLISYYWGVPFCPKGQNPDEYTRVILTQLEVYEKSLKEAQHQLLHKAEWSLPVVPCPEERPFGRRLKRHRAPQRVVEEGDDEDVDGGEEKNEMDGKEREASQSCTQESTENTQSETYVVVSSPEPQEELEQKSPLTFGQPESTSCRKPDAEELSEETRIQQTNEHSEVQNGSFDPESTVCPETQITEDDTPELMVTSPIQTRSWAEGELMEVDEELESHAISKERTERGQAEQEGQWRNSEPAQIQCPMCSRLFPLSKIELHAAYCNGTLEDQSQKENLSQGTARRKRTRRIMMDEESLRSENRSEQKEKCYVCQKLLAASEYCKHVEQCLEKKIQPQDQGNGLLSALDQTEQGYIDDAEAGPSDITTPGIRGLPHMSMMAEAGQSANSKASGYTVSNSPIKSFTPVSEVTDCLIDFTKQYSARTNHRLGRKRKYKR